jgi:hypothetical protein
MSNNGCRVVLERHDGGWKWEMTVRGQLVHGSRNESSLVKAIHRLYPGDEEQLPVPLIGARRRSTPGAPLAPLFVLLVLFLADLAPPFSFFIHLGLLLLTGLLPATALLAASAALLLLLIALNGHLITPCLARGITLRLNQTFRRYYELYSVLSPPRRFRSIAAGPS